MRPRVALWIAGAALVATGCGGSAVTAPSDLTAPSTAPTLAQPTDAGASVEPSQDTSTPAALVVKLTKAPGTVKAGSMASVSVKTTKGAGCTITVEYASGPSTAAGLGNVTSPASGSVTWSWRVGAKTTKGAWPVTIDCSLGAATGEVATSVTVK